MLLYHVYRVTDKFLTTCELQYNIELDKKTKYRIIR